MPITTLAIECLHCTNDIYILVFFYFPIVSCQFFSFFLPCFILAIYLVYLVVWFYLSFSLLLLPISFHSLSGTLWLTSRLVDTNLLAYNPTVAFDRSTDSFSDIGNELDRFHWFQDNIVLNQVAGIQTSPSQLSLWIWFQIQFAVVSWVSSFNLRSYSCVRYIRGPLIRLFAETENRLLQFFGSLKLNQYSQLYQYQPIITSPSLFLVRSAHIHLLDIRIKHRQQ